jgi:hypothetical protein
MEFHIQNKRTRQTALLSVFCTSFLCNEPFHRRSAKALFEFHVEYTVSVKLERNEAKLSGFYPRFLIPHKRAYGSDRHDHASVTIMCFTTETDNNAKGDNERNLRCLPKCERFSLNLLKLLNQIFLLRDKCQL